MKIKTHEGALLSPAVAAEIEALYQEINDLKEIVNANKNVLHELLEVLKNAAIPYRE
jgi:archaellum component FlaC